MTETARDTSYRLAPALGARLVGRSLVTLGVLVVVVTGRRPAGRGRLGTLRVVAVVGLLGLVAVWAWWLLRRARALSA